VEFLRALKNSPKALLLYSLGLFVAIGAFMVFSSLVAVLSVIIIFEVMALCNVQAQLDDWKQREKKKEEEVKRYYSEKFKDIHEKHQEEMSRMSMRSTQSRSGCENILDSSINSPEMNSTRKLSSESESVKEVVKGH